MESISVIMAVKHPAPHLQSALDSIRSQTVMPKEVIVVESGPPLTPSSFPTGFPPVSRFPQSGSGLAQAWNQALAAVGEEWIAWLDSDDIWSPKALAAHTEELSTVPDTEFCAGRVRFFLEGDTPPANFRPELLHGSHRAFMPGTSLVSAQAATQVGPFREDLGVATDIEWFARLRDTVPFTETEQVVLHKRVHAANLSYESASSGDYSAALIATARSRLRNRRGEV